MFSFGCVSRCVLAFVTIGMHSSCVEQADWLLLRQLLHRPDWLLFVHALSHTVGAALTRAFVSLQPRVTVPDTKGKLCF